MKPVKRAGETPPPQGPGRFAYDGLDRTFHEKARLGIMTSLAAHSEPLSFAELRELCALSDGNLNRHLAVLVEAGFVQIEKEGGGRRSRTTCRATAAGRAAFLEYLSELERVLGDAASAQAAKGASNAARVDARSASPGRVNWTTS